MHLLEEECAVTSNRQVADETWEMSVESPHLARSARPGQFCMLKTDRRLDPILRRPFTFHRLLPGEGRFDILYKVIGRGTELMTRVRPGGTVHVLGPLGNGYTLPGGASRIVTVSRGVGIAGLVALAEAARKAGTDVVCLASFRTKESVTAVDVLGELGCEVALHTDDIDGGSTLVTDGLEKMLGRKKVDQFYVAGSKRLAMAAYRYASERGISVQVSLEQRMACGMAACLGCVIEVFASQKRDSKVYRRVCTEGPVFNGWEVCGLD